jgi:hypothetical protein
MSPRHGTGATGTSSPGLGTQDCCDGGAMLRTVYPICTAAGTLRAILTEQHDDFPSNGKAVERYILVLAEGGRGTEENGKEPAGGRGDAGSADADHRGRMQSPSARLVWHCSALCTTTSLQHQWERFPDFLNQSNQFSFIFCSDGVCGHVFFSHPTNALPLYPWLLHCVHKVLVCIDIRCDRALRKTVAVMQRL